MCPEAWSPFLGLYFLVRTHFKPWGDVFRGAEWGKLQCSSVHSLRLRFFFSSSRSLLDKGLRGAWARSQQRYPCSAFFKPLKLSLSVFKFFVPRNQTTVIYVHIPWRREPISFLKFNCSHEQRIVYWNEQTFYSCLKCIYLLDKYCVKHAFPPRQSFFSSKNRQVWMEISLIILSVKYCLNTCLFNKSCIFQ